MSNAIDLIVEGYVRLNDRKSLQDLLAHRQKLLGDLQGRSGFDYSSAIRPLREEISAIEAGLHEVDQAPSPAFAPEASPPASGGGDAQDGEER